MERELEKFKTNEKTRLFDISESKLPWICASIYICIGGIKCVSVLRAKERE